MHKPEPTQPMSASESADIGIKFTQEQIMELVSRGVKSGVKNSLKKGKRSVTQAEIDAIKHVEQAKSKRRAANKQARKSRQKNR